MATAQKLIQVVAGLIFHDGRLLVCQRHERAAFPLKWEFPGGKVEFGESGMDALTRELLEELGIAVLDARQVFQHQHFYPEGPQVALKFYRILSYQGTVRNMVFQRIQWFSLLELGQLDFLEADRPLIQRMISGGAAAMFY